MTSALKEELKKWLNQLAADERKDPTRYHDSGMLFRLPNGLAVEPVLIRKKFLKWQDAHPEFPRIVFHGLRHSSATYQLMISGGDVKAVQGTTGHATADMLVNTYAHIQQSSRVELGRKFEEGFYAKQESPSPQAVPAEGEPTISMTALLELLKNADPEVKAQLRLNHFGKVGFIAVALPCAIKTEQFILRQFDEFRVKELFHGRFILHIRLGADSVNDRPEFFPCHSRIHQINSGVCACSSRVSASSTASV